jgi:arginine decarboxylase
VNYSIQEYANDIVYAMAEACRENELPMPHLISESGSALTAHHTVLLINVIALETQIVEDRDEIPEEMHAVVHDLADTLHGMDERSLREVFHDASFWKDSDALALQRGRAESARACPRGATLPGDHHARGRAGAEGSRGVGGPSSRRWRPSSRTDTSATSPSSSPSRTPGRSTSSSRSCPSTGLKERPTRRGTLQDVTCDSDGKIDRFVGDRDGKRSLELHTFDPSEPYILGIFITGAYQEILGDLHNLFGDTNIVHLALTGDDEYEVKDLWRGDTVTDVLRYVQYDSETLIANFRRKVSRAIASTGLSRSEANTFIADYIEGLAGYTYLE